MLMALNEKNCVPFEEFVKVLADQMCKGKTEQEIGEMWKELEEGFNAIKEHRYEDTEEEDDDDT